jgi:hypothetical protein
MSINVAMDRGKEVVPTKVVKPVLRTTKLSKQYGSVFAERVVSVDGA